MGTSNDSPKLNESLGNSFDSFKNNENDDEDVSRNSSVGMSQIKKSDVILSADLTEEFGIYDEADVFGCSQTFSNLASASDNRNDSEELLTDERDLVEAARNGDSLAITLLVVKYHRFLDKYVGLLNIPIRYKEDFIQEGLIGLLRAVRSFDGNFNCSFSTYAKRCVKNAVISELRRHTVRGIGKELSIDELPGGIDGMLEVATGSAAISPENEYIDRESSEQLHDTIFSVLSTYEAEVFEMYLAEIPYSTIASRLGKDIKSIDNAIQRIKNKLKKLV